MNKPQTAIVSLKKTLRKFKAENKKLRAEVSRLKAELKDVAKYDLHSLLLERDSIGEKCDRLEAENAEQNRTISRLLEKATDTALSLTRKDELLRELEWHETYDRDGDAIWKCKICGAWTTEYFPAEKVHKPDCKLAAELPEPEEA